MNAIPQNTPSFFSKLSDATKALLAGIALLAVFVTLFNVDIDYRAKRVVATSVIAKTQGAAPTKSGVRPYFLLAVRHPDGTMQDVHTSFAEYSQIDIGSKWRMEVSDESLRRERPLNAKLWLLACILSAMGAVMAFMFAVFLVED